MIALKYCKPNNELYVTGLSDAVYIKQVLCRAHTAARLSCWLGPWQVVAWNSPGLIGAGAIAGTAAAYPMRHHKLRLIGMSAGAIGCTCFAWMEG